jgi:hypothetical protein
MKLSLTFALAIAGTVGAFQPSSKSTLTLNSKNKVVTQPVRPGASLTKAAMVAIRNPFWSSFGSPKTPEAKIDYVVDRDYSVALTLILVGIWLTMFHPSKYGYYLCLSSSG